MKNLTALQVLVAALSTALFACSSPPPQPDPEVGPRALTGPSVSIMAFNVENLFDTVHDQGKNDVAYLPLAVKQNDPVLMAMCDEMTTEYYKKECRETDWNEKVLDVKMARVAQVIRQIDGGMGPDILLLEEVENKNVLEILRERQLADVGYDTIALLEGDDERGIDVGVMSRLKEWDRPILHKVPFKGANTKESERASKTRGILEARLLLEDGTKLSVFVVHLPSQSNPKWMREQALAHLNLLKSQLPADVLAIAGGDFNVSKGEEAKEHFIANMLAPNWQVSHLVGCKGCDGTSYYHPLKEWSFFDVLLFAPSMKASGPAKWVLDPLSIRIPHDVREQINQWGQPNRFSLATGVSDHWPMFAKIVLVK